MICSRAGQSPFIIEQINVSTENKGVELIRDNLTLDNKTIYDNFCNKFAANLSVCINNFSGFIDLARFTDKVILNENLNFDYNLLLNNDKIIVDNFVLLISES